jgi:hypothetical protein
VWEPVANTEIQPSIDDQSSITLGESNESNYPNISLYNLEKIPFHRGMSMATLGQRFSFGGEKWWRGGSEENLWARSVEIHFHDVTDEY